MKRRHSFFLGATFGLVCVLIVCSFPGTGTAAQETKKPELKCCYTHPQYTGVCQVTPTEGETCSTILAYLNNPNSQGKNYCGGTNIRGGWKLVQCEEDGQAACSIGSGS